MIERENLTTMTWRIAVVSLLASDEKFTPTTEATMLELLDQHHNLPQSMHSSRRLFNTLVGVLLR
jgi:hypothetical protein